MPHGLLAVGDPIGDAPDWTDGPVVTGTDESLLVNTLHAIDGETTVFVAPPGVKEGGVDKGVVVFDGELRLPSGTLVVETVDGLTIAEMTGTGTPRTAKVEITVDVVVHPSVVSIAIRSLR